MPAWSFFALAAVISATVVRGAPYVICEVDSAPINGSAITPGKLRDVVENSGICETTPDVFQASGYADLTSNKSLWFWYFAARNNPETAPLVLYVDGGPGVSGMIGLLQEHGPCRITNDSSSVTLNSHSWNNEVNMIYLDQPVGVGFSTGEMVIDTSPKAAADVWSFMQVFLNDTRFSSFQGRPLGVWSQSYGGHFAPAITARFLEQNAQIDAGAVSGQKLNLKFLGIGNGMTDPLTQYPLYAEYAANNPYYPLTNASNICRARAAFSDPGGCRDQIQNCYTTDSNSICSQAIQFCNDKILFSLVDEVDMYYILAKQPNPYPANITNFTNNIAPIIGGQKKFSPGSTEIVAKFFASGDWMRNFRPDLETTIKAGVRTLIYAGDADFIVNFMGVEAMVDALQTQFTPEYNQTKFETYNVNGKPAGQFRNAGNFSYLRIFGAGHQAPAYGFNGLEAGEVAAQMFTQIMADKELTSS
ncbi:hypothetical protein AMATHDRAFT_152834 [Amanita thiersii Skay4041]|uniref:Carboxypeptidase n=1 Tax=Amanita thiersii Skay4041 TaxID=703135 RepID=A0A2A9NHG5_9AGAR|nr:hypothetical protein AMATHDRAFT_152834 [Amanita thiersii Skay4041]